MQAKWLLKRYVEKLSGLSILRSLPRGVEPFTDIVRTFPNYSPSRIFDVGGNTGQSVKKFRRSFAKAHVYSFEPVREVYDTLALGCKHDRFVHPFNLALGSEVGKTVMRLTQNPTMNYVQRAGCSEWAPASPVVGEEIVAATTLDRFCEEEEIFSIGYLKIDTEGHDLAVLRGAGKLLSNSMVDFIEIECGISPENKTHIPANTIVDELSSYEYRLFGIYEQSHEWVHKLPIIRRVNLLFVSKNLWQNLPSR